MHFSKIYPVAGLDRPLGLQEVGFSRIYRQSAHESAKVVNPNPQEVPRVLISVRGIVRPEGLSE